MKFDMKTITVVIPIYRERENIQAFYNSLSSVLEKLNKYSWQISFVDDGSDDDSASIVEELIQIDKRVKLISLSRNFGKEAALTAGVIEAIASDAIITIDADLQHPPNIIPSFLNEWENGNPVVVGIRKSVGSHSFFRKLGSNMYYLIMEKIGGNHIVRGSTDFRLIDKKVAVEFAKFSEQILMFRGSIDWLGFRTRQVEFDAPERFAGEAGYSYRKLFSLAVNSITSFSLWPLKVSGYLGIVISSMSFIILVSCLSLNMYKAIWYVTPLALFVIFNTFLVGLLMICLGLIALYIGNISNEVVKRPNYVISEIKHYDNND